ncbi:unnamed protein product [marine sediment metagenome]|uniref:Helix-turn-helix domain-containing protein n=1 Tax=marine sediment metagenome TaxID=412755 RepID=X1MW65_9ZZZZ
MGRNKPKCVWLDLRDLEKFVRQQKAKAVKERTTGKPMNANQVAAFLGVHRYEVYRYVKDKGLPVMKLSARAWRFDKEAVIKWMKKREKMVE